MDFVGEIDENIELYTAQVNSPHMKQDFRIAYVRSRTKPEQYLVLASTDLELDARTIVRYYSLRFQIEMIFRDAKQHWGLEDFMVVKEESVLRTQEKITFTVLLILRLYFIVPFSMKLRFF